MTSVIDFKGRTIVAAAALALLAVTVSRFAFRLSGSPMDEGFLLVYPEQILHGRLPYRDFETFYGPLNLWILAACYKIFGVTVTCERAVGLFYRVALILGFFAVGQRRGLLIGLLCGVLCLLFVFPIFIALAWMGAAAAGIWSLWFLEGPENETATICWSSAIAGLMAACAIMFRLDLGPAVLVAAAILWWRKPTRSKLAWVVGFAVALIPLAWLVLTAGLRPFIENAFIYPVLHGNGARRLPLRGPFFQYLAVCLVFLLSGFAAALRLARATRLHLALSIFCIFATSQAIQRADEIHVGMFASIALPSSALAMIAFLACWRPRWRTDVVAVGLVAVILSAVALARPRILRIAILMAWASLHPLGETSPAVRVGQREFPLGSRREAASLQQLCERLMQLGRPGQRLFVGPRDLRRTNYNDTFIYYLLPQFVPASYFLEMNPGSANRPGSRLAADIATADWVLLDAKWDDWQEANTSNAPQSEAPLRTIASHFTKVDAAGQFTLFQHNEVAAAGGRSN